jgi:hypothetical protein
VCKQLIRLPEGQTLQGNADEKISLAFFDKAARLCFFMKISFLAPTKPLPYCLTEANQENPLHFWAYLSASNGRLNFPKYIIGRLKW